MTQTLAIPTEHVNIPDYLIKEVINGIPYYYKGYKSVLNKEKTLEDIMGSSTLQSLVIDLILDILYTKVGRKNYYFFTSEVGNHLSKKNNLSLDIAIFDRKKLTSENINEHYASVAPKLIIEIDVKIDINDKNEIEYISNKTSKLLEFGTERVIWILTKSKKIIVAEPNKDWIFADWNRETALVDGKKFNIAQLLKDEGVE